MDEVLALLQWPAMVLTVVASWLVGSTRPGRRKLSFGIFLLSNVLWVTWGAHTNATALVVMQFCLAAMNIRAAMKTNAAVVG